MEPGERERLYQRTLELLPKYGDLAALALNQAALLEDVTVESADHYTELVAGFEVWREQRS